MLTRSAYRGGRLLAPNVATPRTLPWSAGSLGRHLSTKDSIASVLSKPLPGSIGCYSSLEGTKRNFSTSLVSRKGEKEGIPFIGDGEDGDKQMAELLGRMGGNSRHMRKLLKEADQQLLEQQSDKDSIGPYDDVDEDIDPFEQDPDEEPAYKTMYLPNDKLDQMIKTGFIKPLHEIDPLENEPLPPEVAALPVNDKMFLKKFFMKLQTAKVHPSAYTYKHAWRLFRVLYQKTHLAKLFNEHVWGKLWALEKDPIPSPKKVWLGDLMCHVGAELSESQWIGYIEALFWHGQRDKAFQIWNAGLENNPSMIWYTVGTRLHATENQPDASKKIIDLVIRRHGQAIPKLFIPTIVCYHALSESSGLQNLQAKEKRYNAEAVKLYHLMVKYCPDIQPKEYLRVALSFLEAGYIKDAMSVYEHALSVHPNLIDDQATAMYWDYKWSAATVNAQNNMNMDEDELRYLSVSALKLMSEKHKVKIILGNWMRNLIRRNRIEAALRIARTMQTLHLQMDTTTYNLFIMLLDEHGKVGMLEVLCSRMIRKLLEPMYRANATFQQVLHEPEFQPQEPNELNLRDGVGARQTNAIIHTSKGLPDGVEEILARFEQRPELQLPVVNEIRPPPLSDIAETIFTDLMKDEDWVPPADPATFGLLLRSATKNRNVLKATSVLDLFTKAKMVPNAQLLNPMLSMLSNEREYEKLFKTQAIFADPEGFNITPNSTQYKILWISLLRALNTDEDVSKLPTPRKLFHDMVMLGPSAAPTRLMYNRILRCFWWAKDPVGAYTAMHGMALVWNMYPQKAATEITVVGVARMMARGQNRVARRHAYWYMKRLAREEYPAWKLSDPLRRQKSMIQKYWARNMRRKARMRREIKEMAARGEDIGPLLHEFAALSRRLANYKVKTAGLEQKIRVYWEQPPIGFNLPRTEEAKAAVSGAIPIDLDKGGDEVRMSDETTAQISEYIRRRFYNGEPWPREWAEEVFIARMQMGVADEEAIERRRMSIFDAD